jgi:formimidoylglutamate deiminase
LNRWLFSVGDRAVRDVYVAGEQLIDQGHHRQEEQIAEEMAKVLKALLG